MPRIRDVAVICRSKNADPFLLTLDVVFPDRETFDKVQASGSSAVSHRQAIQSDGERRVAGGVPASQYLQSHYPQAARLRFPPRLQRLRRPATRTADGRGTAHLARPPGRTQQPPR